MVELPSQDVIDSVVSQIIDSAMMTDDEETQVDEQGAGAGASGGEEEADACERSMRGGGAKRGQ